MMTFQKEQTLEYYNTLKDYDIWAFPIYNLLFGEA